MPKFTVQKQKLIQAPIEKVYDLVGDMSHWAKWSPWLISEPEAKVDVNNDGSQYAWSGHRVGEGKMLITNKTDKEISYDLTIIKPWKALSKVKMSLKELDNSKKATQLTWEMEGSLPFFMFFYKKMMTKLIGMDYERGLNLLKDYAEDGKVHSTLNFHGVSTYSGCNYIGIKRKCSFEASAKFMKEDFTGLMSFARTDDNYSPEKAFTIYHKWDLSKGLVEYTAGVPYQTEPSNLEDQYFKSSIPKTKIYTIEHVGPYHHLGNAWSTLIAMQRNKEFKVVKGIHPFETYGNSPMDTDPKDLIARINFPIK